MRKLNFAIFIIHINPAHLAIALTLLISTGSRKPRDPGQSVPTVNLSPRDCLFLSLSPSHKRWRGTDRRINSQERERGVSDDNPLYVCNPSSFYLEYKAVMKSYLLNFDRIM